MYKGEVVTWYEIFKKTSATVIAIDVEEAAFNLHFAQAPNRIIKRTCDDCSSDYKEMYYRRFTNEPWNAYVATKSKRLLG